MPKKAKELTATEVRRLARPGLYAVGGLSGLLLQVTASGAKSWIYRFSTKEMLTSSTGKPYAKRRDMGLGPFPDVSLGAARERARKAQDLLYQGIDPIEARNAAHGALITASAKAKTFDQCAQEYISDKLAKRSPKNRQAWANTIRDYASPVIGKIPIADIERIHIVNTIKPIWETRTETAKRLRGRIESILDWAAFHGLREGENPAKWKGNLEYALKMPSEVHTVRHFRALPWQEIGEFLLKLRERQGMAVKCLELIILTGLRSGEVRGAKWREIDLKARTWTVPAERMKMNKAHTVPLCDDAMRLLEAMPRFEGNDLVFPGGRGGVMSDVAVTKPIRVMGYDVTVHGFRSTLRDWIAENTSYPHHVQEMVLAHAVSNEIEKAYRRGDLLAKRTRLMADWCRYINSPAKSGEVVGIREGAK